MFKNFIPSVRKSLYDKKATHEDGRTTEIKQVKNKKEKINQFEEYNSENVFASDQNIAGNSGNVLSNSKNKRKVSKKICKSKSDELMPNMNEMQKVRKRKKASSDTSSSDLVMENKHNFSPSKSELGKMVQKHKLPRKMNNSSQRRSSLISLSNHSSSDKPKSSKVLRRRRSLPATALDDDKLSMDCSTIKSGIRKSSSSIMDVESFQIEDLIESDEFNWEHLSDLNTQSTISMGSSQKKMKKKKREVSRLSTLSDETDNSFNLEQWSKQADIGAISNESTDYGCSFITKKLKNVRIESAVVVDKFLFSKDMKNNVPNFEHTCEPIPLENNGNLLEKPAANNESKVTLTKLMTPDKGNSFGVDFNGTPVITPKSTETDTSNVNEKNIRVTNTKYIAIDSKRVVVLKHREHIPVFGIFTLRVLYGKLEVLGNILHKDSPEANIYSPRGSALLYLRNASDGREPGFEEMKKLEWFGKYKIFETDVVVECIVLKDVRVDFIEQYISHQIFPKIYGRAPRVVFEPKDDLAIITVSDSWNELINSITSTTKLMITGGKGVGKSTFLRYTINSLLCTYDKVRVIDLDPGQSEFTLPGGISVVTVEEPIFGSNYTHLKKPERSYLCGIDIGHDPRFYINCIKQLMEYVNTLESMPTVINYMGFVKGLGMSIVSSAITFIKPTDIVQINSAKRKNNFVNDLSVITVMQNCHMFGSDGVDFQYNLHILNAMTDSNNGWTLEPRQMREICVLAYLGEMMTDSAVALTSHMLPMYIVQLTSIHIVDLQGNKLHPSTINANLVALCSRCQESNIFSCLGYGVVRGIDLEQKYLVLLTPEDPEILDEVEYLVMTRLLLPPAVYMSPQDVEGNIPYVMEGELVSLAQITRRSYLPHNKK